MIFGVLIIESLIRSLRNNVYCFVLVKLSYASSPEGECKLNNFIILPNWTSTLGTIIFTLFSGNVHCSFPLWKIYVWPWQKIIFFCAYSKYSRQAQACLWHNSGFKSKLKVAMLNSFDPKSLPFKGLNLFKIFNVTYLEFSDWFWKKWDNFCHGRNLLTFSLEQEPRRWGVL